jgi:hypothetical protein
MGDAGHEEHSGSSCCQDGCSGRCSGESGSSSKDVLAHPLLLTGVISLFSMNWSLLALTGLIVISSSVLDQERLPRRRRSAWYFW